MNRQRGNVLVGIVIGIVIGLAVALAVAVYVTKVPVPFLSRNQGRTAEQDAAESKKNRDWDPNAPLYGKNPAKTLPPAAAPAPAASSAPQPPAVAGPSDRPAAPAVGSTGKAAPAADPLGDFAAAKASSGAPEPFLYFVQTGAFRSQDDAEAQRAKLSLMGVEARVTEREQSGRTVYRVRVGPFERKDDADRSKDKLEAGGIETALVRVQR